MILAITVTVLLLQFSVALRASTTAQEVTRATLYAKLKLEELKMAEELAESAQSGTFGDGYDWETRVLPYTHEQQRRKMNRSTIICASRPFSLSQP